MSFVDRRLAGLTAVALLELRGTVHHCDVLLERLHIPCDWSATMRDEEKQRVHTGKLVQGPSEQSLPGSTVSIRTYW